MIFNDLVRFIGTEATPPHVEIMIYHADLSTMPLVFSSASKSIGKQI
jgi:hypothetical protein